MIYVNMENNAWMLVMNPYDGFKAMGTRTSPRLLAGGQHSTAREMGIPIEILSRGAAHVSGYISEVFRTRDQKAWEANPITEDTEMWFVRLDSVRASDHDKWWQKLSPNERVQVVQIYRDGTPYKTASPSEFAGDGEKKKVLYLEVKRYWDMHYPGEPMF